MSKNLQLTFITADNGKANMTLANPKENLDQGTVEATMEAMVQSGVFMSKESAYQAPFSAQYVERTVTEVFAPEG